LFLCFFLCIDEDNLLLAGPDQTQFFSSAVLDRFGIVSPVKLCAQAVLLNEGCLLIDSDTAKVCLQSTKIEPANEKEAAN